MRTADFDFVLPPERIAQHPAPERDASRLLVLHRPDGQLEHRQFRELPDLVQAGDVLVLNDSRVIPARLHGVNARSGGRFEVLLLEENERNDWWAMLRPARRARVGTVIQIQTPSAAPAASRNLCAVVLAKNAEGHRRLGFDSRQDLKRLLGELGEMPLPPYIHRERELPEDRERYQTVYAGSGGSIAAPTAGLHFTPGLLNQIRSRGARICFVTLHVGAGTFLPVKTETLAAHQMHQEWFSVSEDAARQINDARASGRRVLAVGTTTVRALESVAAQNHGKVRRTLGKTGIFIHPPFHFQVVDALLTNFHLPRSTLLMLVSAFASPDGVRGRDLLLAAYAEAIRRRYRFYSYGDAMLVL